MGAALRVYTPADRAGEASGTFARLPDKAIGDKRLKGSALLVLAGLVKGLWGEARVVYVTREQLAREIGKSVNTVNRGLRKLEELGYVHRSRDYAKSYAPHCVDLLFRLRGPKKPAPPGAVEGDPEHCMQSGSFARLTVRFRTDDHVEMPASSPPMGQEMASSSPLGKAGELVRRCRCEDAEGRAARLLLRHALRDGLDLGGVDVTPDELRRWTEEWAFGAIGAETTDRRVSRQRSAAAGDSGGAAVRRCGAEGDRTLNLSIANAALSQLSYRPGRWVILHQSNVENASTQAKMKGVAAVQHGPDTGLVHPRGSTNQERTTHDRKSICALCAALVAMAIGLAICASTTSTCPGGRPRSAWWIGNRSRTIRSLPEPDRTPGTARFASVALS